MNLDSNLKIDSSIKINNLMKNALKSTQLDNNKEEIIV